MSERFLICTDFIDFKDFKLLIYPYAFRHHYNFPENPGLVFQ